MKLTRTFVSIMFVSCGGFRQLLNANIQVGPSINIYTLGCFHLGLVPMFHGSQLLTLIPCLPLKGIMLCLWGYFGFVLQATVGNRQPTREN